MNNILNFIRFPVQETLRLNIAQRLLVPATGNLVSIRNKLVKASPNIKNKGGNGIRPKHRGWKRLDGHRVTAGTILATQNKTRWHPGLYVGLGKNGTLFAMEAGTVYVTCEKINPNWEHTWIQRCYSGRENQVIYKKHFNIIPEKQHCRFKLVDAI